MSALRKLRALRQAAASLETQQPPVEEEEETIEEKHIEPKNNAFAMLEEEDGDENENENENEDVQEESQVEQVTAPKKQKQKKPKEKTTPAPTSTSTSTSTSISKAKKSKKPVPTPSPQPDDDIDSMLSELGITPTSHDTSDEKKLHTWNAILSCDTKMMDADAESKQRFGARAVKKERNQRHARGPATLRRTTHLIHPSDETFPPLMDRGIHMSRVNTYHADNRNYYAENITTTSATSHGHGNIVTLSDLNNVSATSTSTSTTTSTRTTQSLNVPSGITLFNFQHERSYDLLQQEYLSCVETHDPNTLAFFSRQHPYHADCALQLSHLFESQGEFSTAHLLVQRIIYMYECCFHNEFSVTKGTCRLDPAVPENRSFMVALSRHVQMLGKKGTPRTALEVLKFLLSLSPIDDPQCTLLYLDYYALRSQQYQYLLDFIPTYEQLVFTPSTLTTAAQSPSLMRTSYQPNMMYSAALAAYYLETGNYTSIKNMEQKSEMKNYKKCTPYDGALTTPPPILRSGGHSLRHELDEPPSTSTSTASQRLQEAILLYPEVVAVLLTHINDKLLQAPRWSRIITHLTNMHHTTCSPSPLLDKLILIYGERCHGLWKSDHVMEWLYTTCDLLLTKLADGKIDGANWGKARHALLTSIVPAFPNAIRELQKSQYSDFVPTVPAEFQRPQFAAPAQPPPPGQPLDLNANPLLVFLRSLMPWYHVPGTGAGAGQEGEGGEGQGEIHPDDFVPDDAFQE